MVQLRLVACVFAICCLFVGDALSFENTKNLCGVDCLFLIEQNFDVAKGNYPKLLKEMGPIPTAGVSMDDISQRLQSKGLVCAAVKSSAGDLWKELAKFDASIIVVAHVLPNHFVILRKPTKDNEFLVRDPSSPRSTMLNQTAFSGNFLVVSKVPLNIAFTKQYFWFLLVCVSILAAIGLAMIARKRVFGLGLSCLVLLTVSLSGSGCNRPAGISSKMIEETQELKSNDNLFSTSTLDLGRLRVKEPYSIEIPISLPPVSCRTTLSFRSSCDCLGTEIIDVEGETKMRINVRTTATGNKGVSLDVGYKMESGNIHQEQLQISYAVAGDWIINPVELDFRRVQSQKTKELFIDITNFDGKDLDASRPLQVVVADDSGSLTAQQEEQRLRISINVSHGTPTGHYIGQIRVANESDQIGTATAFWEVIASE